MSQLPSKVTFAVLFCVLCLGTSSLEAVSPVPGSRPQVLPRTQGNPARYRMYLEMVGGRWVPVLKIFFDGFQFGTEIGNGHTLPKRSSQPQPQHLGSESHGNSIIQDPNVPDSLDRRPVHAFGVEDFS